MKTRTLTIVLGTAFALSLPMVASAQSAEGWTPSQEHQRMVQAQNVVGTVVNRAPDRLVIRTDHNQLMELTITSRSLKAEGIYPNEYVRVFYRQSAKTGQRDLVELVPQPFYPANPDASGARVLSRAASAPRAQAQKARW